MASGGSDLSNRDKDIESDAQENREMDALHSSLQKVHIDDNSELLGDGDEPPKAPTSAPTTEPEISSEDSVEHRNRKEAPETSTSAAQRESVTTSDNSELRGDGDEPPKAPTSAPTTEPGARQQSDMLVNFHAPILPVICNRKNPVRGWLIKRKLEQETTRKCIKCDDGEWLTPREFLVKGGYERRSNWKRVIFCHGKTLEELMQKKYICESHPRLGSTREAEKTKSCKVCQDKRTLLSCNQCENLFHGDCHIPPEDIESNGWCCTFCKVGNLQSQQHYRESEAVERQMEPEKLKCALFLLKVYCHLENIFLEIPLENYVEEASQCLEKFMNLDIIKENLIEGRYPCVESFMQAMDEFFTAPGWERLHLNQEEFMKNYKEVFDIQETD